MIKVSISAQICIFGAIFIIGLIVTGTLNSILTSFEIATRTQFIVVSLVQNVMAFCLPSFIVAAFGHKGVMETLSLNKIPSLKSILGVVIAFTLGYVMLNQIVYWNDSVKLPESLSKFEISLRTMEEQARNTSETIMNVNTVSGLLVNVLAIGLITGFSEEIFFRAGLQRLLSKAIPKYWAVWVAAIIFSTLHFQFYGFVPRVILGAFFGFLYVWTGSIWLSAFAHALNNSLVVVLDWMLHQGIISVNPEYIGVSEHGFPIYASISAVLFIAFIMYGKNRFFNKLTSKTK